MTDTVSNRSLAIVALLVIFAMTLIACKSATTVTPGPTKTPTRVPPTADPSLGIGSTQVSDRDGMTLLYVPAGEFTMGNKEGDSDEVPEHSVYLEAFWIDQTEVTKAMYAKCVKAGACFFPMDHYDHPKYDNYPVVFVAWDDAKKYCEWAGGDLPTEAQWEKAARGTDSRLYP
jgi:eukaryotic-like serine/threonine-protein kinase